jgi:glucose/arabinose dehydrogenase
MSLRTFAAAGLAIMAVAPPALAQLQDPIPAPIPQSTISVKVAPVATGFVAPCQMVVVPGWGNRAFVVDQTGRVLLLKNGVVQPAPFLDISGSFASLLPAFPGASMGLNPSYDERGLLSVAFHPGFLDKRSPGFRTLYTLHNVPHGRVADVPEPPYPNAGVVPNCQEVIAEWKVNARSPETVDPNSYREVLRYDKPEFNHNGGTLLFDSDGYLYASFGDGGNKNDIGDGHNPAIGNAQDLSTVLGKIIRIHPVNPKLTGPKAGAVSANGQYRIPTHNPFFLRPGALKEIYAYGFRNPYRMSFDAAHGSLIVADVGQDKVEEVDIVVRGGNYGWPIKEGAFLFNRNTGAVYTDTNPNKALINPVVEYDHDDFEKPNVEVPISIIGGFVYRGTAIPRLKGKYVFSDFTGILFDADLKTGKIERLLDLGVYVKGFGEDISHELYVLATTKEGPSGNTGTVLAIKAVKP